MNSIVYSPATKKYNVYYDLQDESNLLGDTCDTFEEAKKRFEWIRTNCMGCCQHDAVIITLKSPENKIQELEERVAKLERQMKRCRKR